MDGYSDIYTVEGAILPRILVLDLTFQQQFWFKMSSSLTIVGVEDRQVTGTFFPTTFDIPSKPELPKLTFHTLQSSLRSFHSQ